MTPALFLSIAAIHLAAAISPGPSFVVSLRVAASEGFGVATALALGFGIGAAVWAAAAMAGLSLLFEILPQLFVGLKLVGAFFLLFIGWMMWKQAKTPLTPPEEQSTPRSAYSAVQLGVLTFLSNPKPAVFFGAVFAGLVPPDTSLAWKTAIVAVVFANETLWYIFVARVFSFSKPRATYIRFKAWIDRSFGTLIALFGLKIATT